MTSSTRPQRELYAINSNNKAWKNVSHIVNMSRYSHKSDTVFFQIDAHTMKLLSHKNGWNYWFLNHKGMEPSFYQLYFTVLYMMSTFLWRTVIVCNYFVTLWCIIGQISSPSLCSVLMSCKVIAGIGWLKPLFILELAYTESSAIYLNNTEHAQTKITCLKQKLVCRRFNSNNS